MGLGMLLKGKSEEKEEKGSKRKGGRERNKGEKKYLAKAILFVGFEAVCRFGALRSGAFQLLECIRRVAVAGRWLFRVTKETCFSPQNKFWRRRPNRKE